MTPYDSVLTIAKTYLGPAAESFLARQCQGSVQVEATKLTTAHLKNLAAAVEVAACRFIDRAKAEDMAKRISAVR